MPQLSYTKTHITFKWLLKRILGPLAALLFKIWWSTR